MPRVLFLVNHDVVIYNFRLELVERLIEEGCEVHISSPPGDRINDLVRLGCNYHEISIDRHGMNPFNELSVILHYNKLLKELSPDIVLSYTIKPNIYGAFVCGRRKIPILANITGLGTAVEGFSFSQILTLCLYRIAFRHVNLVFFQNQDNYSFFEKHHIADGRRFLLPGSGVSLKRFPVLPYPDDKVIRFSFISRIMREKGIDYYLEVAKVITQEYRNVEFHVCGFCENEYQGKLAEYAQKGIVVYHGMVRNISAFLNEIHCVIHPTFYPEGLSNVLLESCASGRPIITTDRPGCKEVVDDAVNGFCIKQKDFDSLLIAVRKFLSLSNAQREEMGRAGRIKVEQQFDRQIVVDKYMEEIKSICEK